jgi:protease-4
MRFKLPLLTLPALLAAVPVGAAPTPDFPFPIYGNESVAATDGAWGFTVNPAAGGRRYPAEVLLSFSDVEPGSHVYRGAFSHDGAGVVVSVPDDAARAWLLGFGGGEDRLRIGGSFTRLYENGGSGRASDYDVGLLSRPQPWLSLGAVANHLFQPRFVGELLGREYTMGLGLRPFALIGREANKLGPTLTLTADLLMAEGASSSQARLRFGAELEAGHGLVLRGAVQDHGAFQLGIGLLGSNGAYHGSAAFEADQDRLAVNHALSFHQGEERNTFAESRHRRVAVVPVRGMLGDDALAGFTVMDGPQGTRAVAGIHRQLDRALEDPRTRGVLLELGGAANMAQLEELRPRIARLRQAGKPVVAYLEQGGGRGDLYLAAACTHVVASEEAMFAGLGLRAERRYYKHLLADWGVKIDRSSYGRYKSAYRNYSADSTPAADREAIERTLDVTQELFVSAVAQDRRIARDRLLTVLDGRQWESRDLAHLGLVDSVGYREDALRILGGLAALGPHPRTVDFARTKPARSAWTLPTPIAVVYATGAIESGQSGNDLLLGPTMGSATMVGQLERAFRNPAVRVVVLRVESPGGSGLASNLIDHAIQRLKRETGKPLIVSMGSVAGSGGYYISAHADRIFADRYTRTGSIGVVTIRPSFEGWYAKHGVREDDFERGRFMRGATSARDWDRAIQASVDSSIMDFYRAFVSKVADGRHMEWSAVDAVAQGRVWMGEDALERRLVDEIGGLEEAIVEARRRAGVPAGEKIRILEYRRPQPWLIERLAGSAVASMWARAARIPDANAIYYLADADVDE